MCNFWGKIAILIAANKQWYFTWKLIKKKKIRSKKEKTISVCCVDIAKIADEYDTKK